MEPPKICDVDRDASQNLSPAQRELVQALGRKWEKKSAGDRIKCIHFIRRVCKFSDRDVARQFFIENHISLNKTVVLNETTIREDKLVQLLKELDEFGDSVEDSIKLCAFLEGILEREDLHMEEKLQVFYKAPIQRQMTSSEIQAYAILSKKFNKRFCFLTCNLKFKVDEWSDSEVERCRDLYSSQYHYQLGLEKSSATSIKEGKNRFDAAWNYLKTLQSSRVIDALDKLEEMIKDKKYIELRDFLDQILDREDLRTEEKLQVFYQASSCFKHLTDTATLKRKFSKQFCLKLNDFPYIVDLWDDRDEQHYREGYNKYYRRLYPDINADLYSMAKLNVVLNYCRILHSQKP